MRFSPTGIGCTNELRLLMRRAATPVKQMLEALRITRADVRQRKSQWLLADNVAGLRIDDFGGVRLDETVSTLIPERAPHNAYFVDADLDGRVPFVCDSIEWAGAEPAQIEIKRVKRWLHPRRDPAQPQTVVRWRLDLLRVVKVGGLLGIPAHRQLFVAPLCDPVYADVAGSAEGLVTFDFSAAAIQDRPQPKRYGAPLFADPALALLFAAVPAPTTLLVYTALDKNGAPATNVGAGYDNTVASVTTNGNVLSSRKLIAPAVVLSLANNAPLLFQPGTYGDNGSGGGTPRCIIESGTYVNDDISFTGVGNRIDLGGVPTVPPTLTIQGAVPQGTSMTGQVLKDGGNPAVSGDWRTFISGQTTDLLANVGLRQTYEIRALLNTDATASLTPTLRKLAVEEIGASIDLSEVAELRLSNGYGIDLVTLEGEIPRGAIVAIRDGAHDYHSAIENLLAAAQLGDYTFRVWVGAPTSVLAKQYWLHIDDVLPLGQTPHAPTYEIPVVSVLSKVRALLPKKSPGSSLSPDADLAIGTYTTETGGGAPLFSHINEADADHSTYIRSVLDPVNQTYKATFPTPADLPGRRLYLDYWFMKDAAGGKTIDATIELRQSGAIVMQTIHANILGPDATTGLPVAGSVRLSDASVAAITDPANLELWVTFNVGGAGASRRGILTWAKFRTGDRRQGIAYVNQTGKDTYHDLLVNQLEVDARYIGPELENTTYLIGKVISEVSDEEQPTSKSELEAVTRAFGYGVLASQGKLKVVNMQDPGPIVAVVPLEEVTFLSPPTPGIEDRIDDYVVPFNYNAAKAEFDDECEMVSAAGVLAFGDAEDGSADHRYAQEDAKWIQPQNVADYAVHARAVVKRFIDWFGCGRGRAHVKLPYMFPEAEPGDTLIFEQDLLVLRDPHTGAERRGRLWISAKIELADDPRCLGTQFLVGFRPFFDLLTPGTGETTRLGFVAPDFYELSANVDQAGAVTLIAKARGGQSVKLGWSTVDEATAIANAHASVAQVLDVDGIYRSGTAATLLPDQTLIVAGFAYDRMNGAGAESALMTAKVTFKYLPTIAIISARAVWRGNRLFIQASGGVGVASMKFATDIAAFQAGDTGAAVNGAEILYDAGPFVWGDSVFITITPKSAAAGAGSAGPLMQFRAKLAYADGMFDDGTGKPKRPQVYLDGKYALAAATDDGMLTDPAVLIDPGNGVYEGGAVYKIYRHREEITVNGADADGDFPVSFAQVYQSVPMIVFKGGQYVSFSQTLGTGAGAKHRLRLQAVDATASGFTSPARRSPRSASPPRRRTTSPAATSSTRGAARPRSICSPAARTTTSTRSITASQ
jgi:hypothetical protein